MNENDLYNFREILGTAANWTVGWTTIIEAILVSSGNLKSYNAFHSIIGS